jgi:hypothetical protein
MVGDKPPRPRGKLLRRQTSWRDALKGLASGSEREGTERPVLRMRASTMRGRAAFVRRGSHPPVNGIKDGDDADGSSESEEDFEKMREEDRPIGARVRYVYRETAGGSGECVKMRSGSEGSAASTSTVVPEEGEASAGGKESIGTRLTMTSRTGYFQDRIISPSMVCCCAWGGLVFSELCLPDAVCVRCVQWRYCTLGRIGTRISRLITIFRPSWHRVRCWRSSRRC